MSESREDTTGSQTEGTVREARMEPALQNLNPEIVTRSELTGETRPSQSNARSVTPPDPFDPSSLRLDANAGTSIAVKKLLTSVPVRKPSPQSFFRVHPDEVNWSIQAGTLELKEDREIYLVTATMASELFGQPGFGPRLIVTAMSRQGVVSLWPLSLPGSAGKSNPWWDSAMEAAEKAKTRWTRLAANMDLGAYEISEAGGAIPEPVWPSDVTFHELLRIGFRDRLIDSPDHVVLRRLRGEL